MVISGKGSDRDIYVALELIKQQWEQTHETNTNRNRREDNPEITFRKETEIYHLRRENK